MIEHPVALSELEGLIFELTQARRIFTATQVLMIARQRSMLVGSLLAPAVNSTVVWLFQSGNMLGYERSLLDGLTVYHPIGVLPRRTDIAIDRWLQPVQQAAILPQPTLALTAAPVPGRKYVRNVEDGDEVIRSWREASFVEVPREMLRQAGFQPGEPVLLVGTPTGAALRSQVLFNRRAPTPLRVQTRRLCLRLWKHTLDPMKVGSDEGVVFRFSNGGIEVR